MFCGHMAPQGSVGTCNAAVGAGQAGPPRGMFFRVLDHPPAVAELNRSVGSARKAPAVISQWC